MAEIPRIVKQKLVQPGAIGQSATLVDLAAGHPDADLLTAFAEQTLTANERTGILTHLASCADCRDVLALALPQAAEQQLPAAALAGRSWWQLPVLRWGLGAAAAAVIVTSAVVVHPPHTSPIQRTEVATVASQPGEPAAPPASSAAANAPASTPQISANADALAEPTRERVARNSVASEQAAAERKDTIADLVSARKAKPVRTPQQLAAVASAAPAPMAAPKLTVAPPDRDVLARTDLGFAGNAPAAPVLMSDASDGTALPPGHPDVSGTVVMPPRNAHHHFNVFSAAAGSSARSQGPVTNSMLPQFTVPGYAPSINAKSLRIARWDISASGRLQRSMDGGTTWQQLLPTDSAVFHTVTAVNGEVWAGGDNAALFHSTDYGDHWTSISPSANGLPMQGTVQQIQFSRNHCTVWTDRGETWVSDDGGQSWQVK